MKDSERISYKLNKIVSSITLSLKETAQIARAEGKSIYDFGLGETYGRLPEKLQQAGIEAFKQERTEYTNPSGMPELREAVLHYSGLSDHYSIDNVIISTGAKQCIFNALLAITNPADTVFLDCAPWVSYQPLAVTAYAHPVMVLPLKKMERNKLKMTPDDLLRNIRMRPHGKLLILNNPVNPTAQVYDHEEMNEIIRLCVQNRIFLILDKLYWRIFYNGKQFPEVELDEEVKKWVIFVDGLSKNFTRAGGLRIGFSIGPKDVTSAMANVQSHYTSNPATISQKVALEAVSGQYDNSMVKSLERKRNLILKSARDIPYIKPWPIPATFYSFWDISETKGKRTPEGKIIEDSVHLSEFFLENAGVIVAPGAAFLQDNYLRLSFATADETITEGMHAVKEAVRKLE